MQIPPKTKPRIFLIDAYALIYRAYFAFISRPLMNSAGENTSAPFGFARFLLDIREQFEPDYLAVVFDAGDSFRTDVYPEYKATREKMPDDLRASLGRVRDIVAGFNDSVVELDGYEADDVIGTLAVQAREAGLEAVIVSGDKDFYQLVGPGIHLMNPGRGGATGVAAEWVSEENADEKFGIPPSQIADYLALVGDSSDNVPGARGVGPKTAVKLLEQYTDVEDLIVNAAGLKPPRAARSLEENAEEIRLSKRLVTIMTDLDVVLDLDLLRVRAPNNEVLRDLFVELEFRRLADQFATASQAEGGGTHGLAEVDTEDGVVDYSVVDSVEGLATIIASAHAAGRVAIAVESSNADPLRGDLVGVALSVEGGVAGYLPFGHLQPFELTFEGEGPGAVRNLPSPGHTAMSDFKALLEDPNVRVVGHDLKNVALALSRSGVELALSPGTSGEGGAFDVEIASYVLDPGRRDHGVKALSMEVFSHKPVDRSDVIGSGRAKIAFAERAP